MTVKIAANFQTDDTLTEINQDIYFDVAPIFLENTQENLIKTQLPLYGFEEGKNHLEFHSESNHITLK